MVYELNALATPPPSSARRAEEQLHWILPIYGFHIWSHDVTFCAKPVVYGTLAGNQAG